MKFKQFLKPDKTFQKALMLLIIWSVVSAIYYMRICPVGWLELGGPQGWKEQVTSTFYCNSVTMMIFSSLGESVMFFVNPALWLLGVLSLLFYYCICYIIIWIYDKFRKKK